MGHLQNKPEPFTAKWHAHEMGRLAFRRDNDPVFIGTVMDPFRTWHRLPAAWEEGYEHERETQRQTQADTPADSEAQDVLPISDEVPGQEGGAT